MGKPRAKRSRKGKTRCPLCTLWHNAHEVCPTCNLIDGESVGGPACVDGFVTVHARGGLCSEDRYYEGCMPVMSSLFDERGGEDGEEEEDDQVGVAYGW
jgi:hypothetical protein